MNHTFRYISMAAIALVGTVIAGCTNNVDIAEIPQTADGEAVTLSTTISFDGSTTRALDANGRKTFAAGDKIAFVYKNTSNQTRYAESSALTSDDITNDGKTAKVTATFTDPQASGTLRYIYPAFMSKSSFDPVTEIGDDTTINVSDGLLTQQDGTLATLGSKFDLAVFDGTFTSDAKLPLSANLSNHLAVCEFTIKDHEGTDVTSTVTKLTIQTLTSELTYEINREAAAGPIYVAMLPITTAEDVTFTVNAGETILFQKTVSSVILAANSMYPITLIESVSYVRYDVSGTTATAVNVQTTEPYTILSNSTTDVTWSSGTYVVLSDVTISANVYLADGADVKLIICDGKELKVNSIDGTNATLTIYGQTNSTGKLTADYTNTSVKKDAIWVRYLHVHGGDITAKSNNSCALSIGVANVSPYKYGYLNLYHGQISATGSVSSSGAGAPGMVISGDLTVYSGNIDAQGGAGANFGDGGLHFYTQSGRDPQLNNYGGTIIAKGSDATGSQASPGIDAYQKLSIVNDGIIKATGGQSQNEIGGYGALLSNGGSLSGTGAMEITGGDGSFRGGPGLSDESDCTLEYQSGKLTILGGLANEIASRSSAIEYTNLTNKSGAPVIFQVKTNSATWTNAAPTANDANFANSSSYVGVRIGY